MQRTYRRVAALAFLSAVSLAGCAKTTEVATTKAEPFTLEKVDSGLNRLTVDKLSVERIGIKTSTVREVSRFGGDTTRKVVEYSAVVYLPTGETHVYTNPKPLLFVRQPIKIEYIEGDLAVLSDGPPVGTAIVTTGSAELFGMEFGVGK
jgi:hypothetical protein